MTYDFIVIGAGIAGASVAYELARSSRVCLIEASLVQDFTPRADPLPCSPRVMAAGRFGPSPGRAASFSIARHRVFASTRY